MRVKEPFPVNYSASCRHPAEQTGVHVWGVNNTTQNVPIIRQQSFKDATCVTTTTQHSKHADKPSCHRSHCDLNIKCFDPRNPWLLSNKPDSDLDSSDRPHVGSAEWVTSFPKTCAFKLCQWGSGEPTLRGVIHTEACWQKLAGLGLNLTGWSLWGGSMIVTSFPYSTRGLFSDYGRASCTRGATAASVRADTMMGLVMHFRGADQGLVVLVKY